MANKIVFVGAGPLGLWTAIQIKLQNPAIEIIFKEKYQEYKRGHTLLLKPESFTGCVKDDSGVIQAIIDQLKANPHIRTNDLETRLQELATQLGIRIDRNCLVNTVETDILAEHPDAEMIIGSDGVRSHVRTEVFGPDNAERTPLAYAAQIKYQVQGAAVQENTILEAYPLLKQSNYLASINVGRTVDNKTPVTIQHIIDEETYNALRANATFSKPINLFTDNLETMGIPDKLLQDIKTQLGFRLINGEDILINEVNLTTNELPQQRCKTTTLLKDGRYYGLIGDAALALSYFKGMNSGLQLATKFSREIVSNWEAIRRQEPTALNQYNAYYDVFANKALQRGHQTNDSIKMYDSLIYSGSVLPFQLVYFEEAEIAKFHRCFNITQQASAFYLATDGESAAKNALSVRDWVQDQMNNGGITHLKNRLLQKATAYEDQPQLHALLIRLASLNHERLDFYERAYLGLAISKTIAFLDAPTAESKANYLQFAAQLKPEGRNFYHVVSTVMELIAGVVAIGVGSTLLSSGAGTIAGVALLSFGSLLTAHGLYKAHRQLLTNSETSRLVDGISNKIEIPDPLQQEFVVV